jgi:hypothetical protein
MKSLTMKLTIAAAALFAAGAASAQTMKADIPFAFQTGGKVMAAGTYRVDLRGPAATVILHDAKWESAVIARPVTHIAGKNEQTAKLVFVCGPGPCTLVQAWPGYSEDGLTFRAPKLDRNEEAHLSVIHLRPDAAD